MNMIVNGNNIEIEFAANEDIVPITLNDGKEYKVIPSDQFK